MFQTIADYENDPDASKAEKALIEACRKGIKYEAGGIALPAKDSTDPNITVRADLIRLLAMEATSLHTSGVHLVGALIRGKLNLRFAKCRGGLVLNNCRFAEEPQMDQSELAQLSLSGSHFPGLFAQGVKVTGSLFLTGVTATGTLNVVGAQIGGQLDLSDATLEVDKPNEDNVMALHAQALRVKDGFIFRKLSAVTGWVNLNSAQVGDLGDDADSWGKCSGFILEGFTYDRISGNTHPYTFSARKRWLEKGSRFEGEFRPQPYTQFAKVLRAAGHAGEARKALMERDRHLAIEARRGMGWVKPLHWVWDTILRLVAGYGFAPVRSFWCLLILLGFAWPFAYLTWQEGSFAPNSDVILVSTGWQDKLAKDCLPQTGPTVCIQNPASVWSNDPQAGLDWDSFSAIGYAADLVVPILDLGQTSAWAPSKDRGDWGWWLWWGRWVFAALGWLVTALGAAAITGVIQRNAPD
jgi:hypothetical protein